mgnify:CR=1 FL=1
MDEEVPAIGSGFLIWQAGVRDFLPFRFAKARRGSERLSQKPLVSPRPLGSRDVLNCHPRLKGEVFGTHCNDI